MNFIFILLAAFFGCFLALSWLLRLSGMIPLDKANERSLHTQVTPRIGGMGMVFGVALAMLLQWSPELTVLLAASLALALVSMLDDYIDLPAGGRLITHLIVVGVFLATTLNMGEGWWFALSMLIAIAWMTNLFNFMDGADGLAGGMALFGFAAYAWLAWLGGNLPLMFLCGSVSSAALAFLIFNFPPARLFMGDAGSVPLGFLAGAIGMFGWRDGLWHGFVPVLVFSPFIIDATVTLLRRGLAGEKVWKAHRSHYYQRLVRMGWSHRRLATSAFALMAMTATSGVLSEWNNELNWGVVIVWGVFFCVVMVTIDQRWRRASGEI